MNKETRLFRKEAVFFLFKYKERMNEMKIDKSRFGKEELSQYEALIAKAVVRDEPESEKPGEPAPELKAALKRLERLEKIIEHSELADIARKYTLLGEDEDELADTLGRLKKSDAASYNAYVAALDKSLSLIRKSGIFSEIGKSGSGFSGSGAVDKIGEAATALQSADPGLSRVSAIAKAWENHPELIREYENEYARG